MTKASQDNNLNSTNFLKHFYEYHTEKLKCRDITINMPHSKGLAMINL